MNIDKECMCPVHNVKMNCVSMEYPSCEMNSCAIGQFDHDFLSSGQFHRTTTIRNEVKEKTIVTFVCPHGCTFNAVVKECCYLPDKNNVEIIG